MNFAVKKRTSLIVWLMAVAGLTVWMLSLKNAGEEATAAVKVCVVVSFVAFVFQLINIFFLSRKRITTAIIFLLFFYVFQNGRLLLWALNIEKNDVYLNYFSSTLLSGAVFSSISNLLAGYAGILCCFAPVEKKRMTSLLETRDKKETEVVLGCVVIVLACVVLPINVWKFVVSLGDGRYSTLRELEAKIPSAISFLEYMLSPFAIAYLFYCSDPKRRRICVAMLAIFYAMTAFYGDRTTGIAGLLVLMFAFYIKEEDVKKRKKWVIVGAIGCVALIVFIWFISIFRSNGSFSLSGVANIFLSVFKELGFSCVPLLAVMKIVPTSESFFYGKGYAYSVVGGIIPSSLDFTGTISAITERAHVFENVWQTQYLPFDFGLGFSLNAESYMNFGWYGLISVFLICLVVLYFLNKYQKYEEDEVFYKYVSCILLFAWSTLARRDSYYVWKALTYCVLLIEVFVLLTCKKKRKF